MREQRKLETWGFEGKPYCAGWCWLGEWQTWAWGDCLTLASALPAWSWGRPWQMLFEYHPCLYTDPMQCTDSRTHVPWMIEPDAADAESITVMCLACVHENPGSILWVVGCWPWLLVVVGMLSLCAHGWGQLGEESSQIGSSWEREWFHGEQGRGTPQARARTVSDTNPHGLAMRKTL